MHYAREQVELNNISFMHTPGKEQLGDGLTKPQGPQKFSEHTSFMVGPADVKIEVAHLVLAFYDEGQDIAMATSDDKDLMVWHRRLGHRNYEDVCHFLGIPMPARRPFCAPCVLAKSRRHVSGARATPYLAAPRAAHTFATDIAGPFTIMTRGGNKYLCVLVCAFSKKIFALLFKSTREFYGAFKDFIRHQKAHRGTQAVARLHSDGAAYFRKSEQLAVFCKSEGIDQTSSAPFTQSLNGLAERTIKTVTEMGRAMLLHSGLPKTFFGEALVYAVETLNRIAAKNKGRRTRNEIFENTSLTEQFKQLKPFGCASYAHIMTGRTKASAKTAMHVLVGMDSSGNSYRLAAVKTLKIHRSAHVTFNESHFPLADSTITEGPRPAFMHVDEEEEDPAAASPQEEDARPDEPQPEGRRRSARQWTPSRGQLESLAI